MEEQYRRNFQLRVDNPTHFVTAQDDALHEPILTFYLDRVIVNSKHLEKNPYLAFAAFVHFCDREISRSYIFGDTRDDLVLYRRLFREWCVRSGMPEEFVEGLFHLLSLRESRPDAGMSAEEINAAFERYFKTRRSDEIE